MRLIAVLAVAFATLAGAAPAMAAGKPRPSVRTTATAYGRILVDGRRHALYAFTRDARGGTSRCSDACAAAWPPYVVRRRPAAGPGARASLVGTVRRPDGRLQATYRGRPLYFYVGDRRPAQVLCQDVFEYGGRWLVLRGSGKLVH